MRIALFDIEATGLDTDKATPHCVVVRSDSGVETYRPNQIGEAVERLNALAAEGVTLAGHNIIEYDIPLLQRYGLKVSSSVLDTLVMSRAAFPGGSLSEADAKLKNFKARPGEHSLKAWGYRLGEHKAEYTGGFEHFSEDMLSYCVQDAEVNWTLLAHLRSKIPDRASLLECRVAQLCREMRLHGVAFDRRSAEKLTMDLVARREELTVELRKVFRPWYVSDGIKVPKRSMVSRAVKPGEPGYKNVAAGHEYTSIKLTEFNPASGPHIASRLIKVLGWKPKHFTDNSQPSVAAEILHDLPYPEAKLLAEYQEIKKVLGYVAEGTNAWLKLERNGRLHGKVFPTGTVTSRASHSNPNTGNVPTRSKLGKECRALFIASPGKTLVGADASGLQLRVMAHYLARWDDGAFARQCETGDIHEYMRQATGLYIRATQKTWTYAKLFGAGEVKLGQIAIEDHRAAFDKGITADPVPKQGAAKSIGKRTLDNLGNAIPAFVHLTRALKGAAKAGFLTTLDGRKLPIGSEHLAISVLLQGGEACIMKQAMANAAPELVKLGGYYVLWVHDEFQVECSPEHAEAVGKSLVAAMNLAGEQFGLRVRIDGEYHVGRTWADTH